jgi:hypothetical protein
MILVIFFLAVIFLFFLVGFLPQQGIGSCLRSGLARVFGLAFVPVEWVLAQARESRGGDCPQLFRLQLHQDSSYTSHVPGHGSGCDGSALGCK